MLRDVMLPRIRANYFNLLNAASDADLLVTQMLAYAGPLVAEKPAFPGFRRYWRHSRSSLIVTHPFWLRASADCGKRRRSLTP
jgi:hypothetical protein